MKHVKLSDSGARGWFIGQFPEAVHYSDDVEVCYTVCDAGQEQPHYHTKCKEIILIITGSADYNGTVYSDGDILVFESGEVNSMQYLETTAMVGVKVPAGGNDKVLV
jgi:hypothetical protein